MKTDPTVIDEWIARYVTGDLSGKEAEALQAWTLESAENEAYFRKMLEVWSSAVSPQEEDWYDAEKAFTVFKQRIATDTSKGRRSLRKTKRWKQVGRYAATVAVVCLLSIFFYQQGANQLKDTLSQIEVEVPAGSSTKMRLPDGTLVVLNAESRICYAPDFGIDSREVTLEGECYFEVTHNPKVPFYVHSKDMGVKVLGTKFNFCDYPDDPTATVTLLKGKVSLDNKLGSEEGFLLAPGERATLDKQNGRLVKERINRLQNARKWTEGQLTFDETPLPMVAKVLERAYDVKIVLADPTLTDVGFYGNFDRSTQSVKDILDALATTGEFVYTYDEEKKEFVLHKP